MELSFQGGGEVVNLIIDRAKKKLSVSSSKTNYHIVKTPWKYLFDPGKEQEQEKLTDQLSTEDFKNTIIKAMNQYGYKLKE